MRVVGHRGEPWEIVIEPGDTIGFDYGRRVPWEGPAVRAFVTPPNGRFSDVELAELALQQLAASSAQWKSVDGVWERA